MIDVAKGGSLQGVINGLNHILDLAVAGVPRRRAARGSSRATDGCRTRPTSRRIATCSTIIRDRVQDLIDKGMTLDAGEGRQADDGLRRPVRIGRPDPWTTAMFVEAVYKSLQEKK